MSQLSFRERHSALFRLWHWSNFLIITGLLLTVLLRKTVLSYRENAVILQDKLTALNLTLTMAQAKDIARVFRDNMWAWHVNMSLVLAGLLVVRVVAELLADADGRLLHKLGKGLTARRAPEGARDAEATHYTVVKASYVVFYLCLAVMAGSGLALTYGDGAGLSKGVLDGVQEVHESLMYFFLAFIAVHLAGVVRSELTKWPGLVSDMIHGGPKS